MRDVQDQPVVVICVSSHWEENHLPSSHSFVANLHHAACMKNLDTLVMGDLAWTFIGKMLNMVGAEFALSCGGLVAQLDVKLSSTSQIMMLSVQWAMSCIMKIMTELIEYFLNDEHTLVLVFDGLLPPAAYRSVVFQTDPSLFRDCLHIALLRHFPTPRLLVFSVHGLMHFSLLC